MKTVADFVRARAASFCREVLGGRMPREMREVRDRGRRRSCILVRISRRRCSEKGGKGRGKWLGEDRVVRRRKADVRLSPLSRRLSSSRILWLVISVLWHWRAWKCRLPEQWWVMWAPPRSRLWIFEA